MVFVGKGAGGGLYYSPELETPYGCRSFARSLILVVLYIGDDDHWQLLLAIKIEASQSVVSLRLMV